ncbi:PREDICTED: uncharacterized protein LOC105124155 [Populus euphratica]|uniref:Uncharacterized protein LOC105124155 n=1 Tax=Populus euphratica TaxID=75702 RepID=A0AAJ6U397_POPEU|nr:PREDICTED: uncharacterized protein LOC105124155 [Populus euphratica]XP_011022348.1 PREDICTED: uncharacterized protein LOC105124155 [Populus euphratica]XP_011022349.1 PREDICTED: uncharacterized protein LOC105124155 [Populus euphratica]XP_011022350.1 PREDICTED: uncharacterized protein LOC105124155 [Populus euphratica]
MDRKTLSATLKDANNQKVKKRKNRERTKCAKKTKMTQHSLSAIGEEIKETEHENDSMLQMLQRKQLEIKQQKADFCDSQNKIITAHENCVGAFLQEPLFQYLMAGSNQLEIAQRVMFSPNANSDGRVPSEDGIVELKHRSKISFKQIEVLCKILTG